MNFLLKLISLFTACSVLFSKLVEGASFSVKDKIEKLQKGMKTTSDFKEAMASVQWRSSIAEGWKLIKKQFTAIPFGDAACSLIEYLLKHQDEKLQQLKMERGAMFDIMVGVCNGGNSKSVYTQCAVHLSNRRIKDAAAAAEEGDDNASSSSSLNTSVWKQAVSTVMGSKSVSKEEEMAIEEM
jgi:hypothetical protein